MPLLRDMHLESFRLYEALAAELDFAFGHEGRLLLCKTEQGMESVHEEAELMQEIGIEVKWSMPNRRRSAPRSWNWTVWRSVLRARCSLGSGASRAGLGGALRQARSAVERENRSVGVWQTGASHPSSRDDARGFCR